MNAEGIDGATVNNGGNGAPSLIGVGGAAVHFQVSTGRMPLADLRHRHPRRRCSTPTREIAALAAYISLAGAWPRDPTDEQISTEG